MVLDRLVYFRLALTLVKVVFSCVPGALHDYGNDGDRNAGGDQAVLDGRGAQLVLHETSDRECSLGCS